MNFSLSELQAMLQDQAVRVFADHCTHDRLQASIDGDAAFDAVLWDALKDLGLPGLMIPEAHGGSGLGLVEAALIAEAAGYAGAAAPLFGHWLATVALGWGDPLSTGAWLDALASGDQLATVALGEGGEAWGPESWTLTSMNGRLSGTKRFVPNAADAAVIVVGLEGGALGLVETGGSGVTITPVEGVDRTRRLYDVVFEGAAVTPIPGAEGGRLRDAALVLLAADAFGGAERALAMALDYDKQREQFGVVIARFQAVKHQLANVALQVDPCRGLYWYAAYAFDHAPAEAEAMAALAKAHITDRFLQAVRDATELHGGIGYTWEYDLHIWLKRAMADYAWGGSPSAHRLRYADLAGW